MTNPTGDALVAAKQITITDEHRARAKVAYAAWRDAGRLDSTLTDVIALAMATAESEAVERTALRCSEIAKRPLARGLTALLIAKDIRAEFNIKD